MKFYHRHSSFPLILALLTLGLMLLMFYAFTERLQRQPAVEQVVTPVSVSDYEQGLKEVVQTFLAAYPNTTDVSARSSLVDQTLTSLLSLRVPSDYKDLHLSLAVDLNQMKTNEQAFDAFTEKVHSQVWLQ